MYCMLPEFHLHSVADRSICMVICRQITITIFAEVWVGSPFYSVLLYYFVIVFFSRFNFFEVRVIRLEDYFLVPWLFGFSLHLV